MTCEIAEYAACTYTDVGDIESGLPSLQLPTLTPPPCPAANNAIVIEIWKINFKQYHDKVQWCRSNFEKVFFLVMGQCSDALHD
jgi:hypothetical protein